MAHRALGLAPPAHAQLAEQAARLRLRGRRSRRFPHHAGDRRLHRTLRARDLGAGPDRDDGDVRPRRATAAMPSSPTAATGAAGRWCWRPAPATSPPSPRSPQAVPPAIATLTPKDYRNPGQLEEGGVLVVGASATGIQLADEIHRSGRPVTLSVGEHVRVPRIYRGRTSSGGWTPPACSTSAMTKSTTSSERATCPRSSSSARPSARRSTSTRSTGIGVRLVGRLAGIRDGKAQFSGSLRNQCALADLKMARLLDTIDEWATANGLDGEVARSAPLRPDQGRRVAAARPGPRRAARSGRSSGRRASAPTTRGSTCRSSTARGRSATTAAWSRRRACT